MAYTMILVDDEDEVRGRIASKIEGQHDFEIIGSAANGYDALDLLEEKVPDVLVTDIKMPFMDGMELIRNVRERFPTVKVAIISGYDDYTYLKEAINLDVAAYLSKPIADSNIREFLDKIKTSLDEEMAHIELKENMVQAQIRDRYINGYLNDGKLKDEDRQLATELDMDFDGNYVVISMQLMNPPVSIIEAERKKNQCLLMAEEIMDKAFDSYLVVRGRLLVGIVKVPGRSDMKELGILLNKVSNYMKKYLAIELVMGVSEVASFENLKELYGQSRSALEDYDPQDHSAIIYFRNLKFENNSRTLDADEIRAFRHNLRYMDGTAFRVYTQEQADKFTREGNYDLFSVIITLSGLMMAYTNSLESVTPDTMAMDDIKAYVEAGNIKGFMDRLADRILQVKKEAAAAKTKKSVQTVRDIMTFIEDNYMDSELNMDLVCDRFHISVSYLGTLFKKETGTTFNRYLVARRIDRAKWLLKNTDDKMVVVAEKCGYKDVYYFSHSFKKVAGMSPKGFRKHED